METKAPNYTNAGKRLGKPAHGHVLWMRENGCRDNPSGSFSGGTTQIHSIPTFSCTTAQHAPGCRSVRRSQVLPSWYNLLLVFRSGPCYVHCSGWSLVCPLVSCIWQFQWREKDVSGPKQSVNSSLRSRMQSVFCDMYMWAAKSFAAGKVRAQTHTYTHTLSLTYCIT